MAARVVSMSSLFVGLVGCCAFGLLARAEPSASAEPARKIVSCELLTASEIEAVQGDKVVATNPSERTEGSFHVAQCYVALATSSNSVVITVTERAATGASTPREFWQATFHKTEKDEKTGEREEEEKAQPIKVNGLGEEAFWTGNGAGGLLYVLKGDVFLRLSVGGAGDSDAKLARSKKLAQMALRRL
jgi:hypothetical protein